jgi:hypothetical protein
MENDLFFALFDDNDDELEYLISFIFIILLVSGLYF